MGRGVNIPVSQRREAVLILLRKEEPATKLARRYGVTEKTLYRWRDDFLSAGEEALAGKRNGAQQKRVAELEQQIEQRDQVIGELTIANRILKKVQDGSL